MSFMLFLFLMLQVAPTDADRLYRGGNLREAVAAYRQLLASEPRNPVLLAKVGACEYQLGESERAVGHLHAALALEPSLQPARLALGGALLDLHRPNDAIAQLEKVTFRIPYQLEAQRLLGHAYQEANRFFEGERTLTAVLRQNPRDWQSWTYLGMLLYDNNYYARAVEALRAALRIERTNPRARLLEASSQAHLGKYDEAAELFVQLFRDPEVSGSPELLLGYAQFLVETGRSGEAIDPIDKALAAKPDEAKLHFWRARVLMLEGDRQEAAKSARRAIELAPDQPNARNLLLILARQLGDKQEILTQVKWLDAHGTTQRVETK